MSGPRPKVVIAIDGPAASGKSSTAAMVAEALGFALADSGALYRAETARRLGMADIRSPEVTAAVSRVAHIPAVRAQINAELRCIAEGADIVVDGRDMGAVVFPDAQLKIFLIADLRERARRRLRQRLGREPLEREIDPEAVLLTARDARDASHTIPAKDAIVLDTTHLTQEDQVRRIVALASGIVRPAG